MRSRSRCFATLGHLLIYLATVRASAAVVAPMTYVQLIVAVGARLGLVRQRARRADARRRGADHRRRAVAVALAEAAAMVAETPD